MTEHKQGSRSTVADRITDVAKIESVLKEAARQTVLEHARAGQEIAVWRDNRVIWELPRLDGEDSQ